jgi:hypothetical protein
MLVQLLIIALSYAISSLWENYVHWKILHSNKTNRKKWRRLGYLGLLLRRAYFSHNIIHHKNTFKENYFEQFKTRKEQIALNKKLPASLREKIINNRYGLTISSSWEIFTFVAPPLVLNTLLFFNLSSALTVTIFFTISILPAILSKYIHPSLHEESVMLPTNTNLWTRYKKYIAKCHKIHHEKILKNFNLLPGGDFIVGTYEKPDD